MTKIPQPPGLPIIGDIGELDRTNISKRYSRLAGIYGPVFRLNLLGRTYVISGSLDLVKEVCDEKRFFEDLEGTRTQVRHGAGDGLFTGFEHEENWVSRTVV
ncbi:hypothetical protein IMSHALPRED_002415 [Imshaugia aleurites]|uniref:Cytochrome P450 n=1 Tax=Imshaugia aleurites TaxID=172621 RepID=A0A8H3J5S7_9LECA|nr:hypothetical protein IMSHALPRED_002415 [Imshaugia aleurites]